MDPNGPHPHPHPRRQQKSPARGLTNLKINYLLRNHDFFVENTKTESRNRYGRADCAAMPGRHWAQYIDISAPCLPARQVRAS